MCIGTFPTRWQESPLVAEVAADPHLLIVVGDASVDACFDVSVRLSFAPCAKLKNANTVHAYQGGKYTAALWQRRGWAGGLQLPVPPPLGVPTSCTPTRLSW